MAEQDRQGKNAPEKDPGLDFIELAKELEMENPEEAAKQMRGYLPKDISKQEAISRLAKMNVSSQSLLGKKETKINTLEKQLENLAKREATIEGNVGSKEDLEKKEKKTEKDEEAIEILDEIKATRDEIKKELTEVKKIKGQSMRNFQEVDNKLRAEKIKSGFMRMRERLGEERALELLNPANPGKSPLGQFLKPETISDEEAEYREWAKERSKIAWAESDPIRAAMRLVPGCEEDLLKMVSEEPPESETAGRSPKSGQVGNADRKREEIKKDLGVA
jgi:myosin heavy subunit